MPFLGKILKEFSNSKICQSLPVRQFSHFFENDFLLYFHTVSGQIKVGDFKPQAISAADSSKNVGTVRLVLGLYAELLKVKEKNPPIVFFTKMF